LGALENQQLQAQRAEIDALKADTAAAGIPSPAPVSASPTDQPRDLSR